MYWHFSAGGPALGSGLLSRQKAVQPFLTILIVLVAAGCSDDVVDCPDDYDGDPSSLETSYFVEPSMVKPGEAIYSRLTISNPTDCRIVLHGNGGLVAYRVYYRGESVPLKGVSSGFPAIGIPYPVEPHDSLVETAGFIAEIYAYPPPHYVPAPPGLYTAVAEMLVALPNMQDEFIVVE